MQNNPTLDVFMKRLITAPANRQGAAIETALELLNGKPPDRMLYTGAEAARLLSVSTMTVWRMVRSGAIVPVKIRGGTRYRRADLERLAQGEGCAS